MKKYITLVLALLYAGMTHAEDVRGSINFKSANVSQVLGIYSQMIGKELVIDSAATNQVKHITIQIQSATKKEVVELLEKALHDQADIAISPLDDKRLSVKPVKK